MKELDFWIKFKLPTFMTKPTKLLQPKTIAKKENAFSPFTLTFKNKIAESAFVQNYFQNSKVSLRFGILYTFVLLITQFCLNYSGGNLAVANILLGIYIFYGLILIKKSYNNSFAPYMQSLTSFYGFALFVHSSIVFWEFRNIVNYSAFVGILLMIFYTFMRLKFVTSAITGILISSLFLGTLYYLSISNLIFIGSYIFLVNLFGLLMSHRLEYYSKRQFLLTKEITAQNQISDELLLNILPESVAQRLKNKEEYIVDEFNSVSILFCDICGFTPLSAKIPAKKLVKMLNDMFCAFDQIAQKYEIEKIKTMGDCYMAVAGMPVITIDHAYKMAGMALDMKAFVQQFNQHLNVRIGINTGPVIAGVIGIKKFTYDIWGNPVNITQRVEAAGDSGRISIAESTWQHIKTRFETDARGAVEVKHQGLVNMYYLTRLRPDFSSDPAGIMPNDRFWKQE